MVKSDEQVMEEFDEAVNMSRKQLEEWLETDESKGHESGRKTVEVLGKDDSDYTENDIWTLAVARGSSSWH